MRFGYGFSYDPQRDRHTRTVRVVTGAVASALALLLSGCAGGGVTLDGAPTIYPESVTLMRGQTQIFQGGILEVDQHKVSETYRVKESDGGTITQTANPENVTPAPVLYTAPAQAGTYHVQYVWDAGTATEKSATAIVTVTNP